MQFFAGLWTLCLRLGGYGDGLTVQNPIGVNEHSIHLGGGGQSPITGSCNTPEHRDCWSRGFDIHTDYEKSWPHGKLVEETLVISNGHVTGDGYNTPALLINSTYPGPAIEGNWGDRFRITVKNDLKNNNGTAIHWHGLRQYHSNYADGVAGVVQCPIPPGESMVYEFTATQYGTSWYHSHFSLQYTDGIAGPLVIHGPSSANYDIDLGPLMITDWYHEDAFSQFYLEQSGRPPPVAESKLMNGKFLTPNCQPDPSQCVQEKAGAYTATFEKGKKYKWRIVNTSALAHYKFWIDGHNFTVISTDFVPIKPIVLQNLTVAIGQRYEIIVEANADLSTGTDFWINMYDCGRNPDTDDSPYSGIIRYNNASTGIPPHNFPIPTNPNGCEDTPSKDLVPIVKRTVPRPLRKHIVPLGITNYVEKTDPSPLYVWDLSNTSLKIDWGNPSLSYAGLGHSGSETPFPASYAPIKLNGGDNDWKYFVIEGAPKLADLPPHLNQTLPPAPHPIHLHGHDFVILAQSNNSFDINTFDLSTLQVDNPARRDVAMLPALGYLIIAFPMDNPGVWLMHCHIAWHISSGLGLQFVERESEILNYVPGHVRQSYQKQCQKWNKYYANSPSKQDDSGV